MFKKIIFYSTSLEYSLWHILKWSRSSKFVFSIISMYKCFYSITSIKKQTKKPVLKTNLLIYIKETKLNL